MVKPIVNYKLKQVSTMPNINIGFASGFNKLDIDPKSKLIWFSLNQQA